MTRNKAVFVRFKRKKRCFRCIFCAPDAGFYPVFDIVDIFDINASIIAVQWTCMATLPIRNLLPQVKQKLRVRAAMNGRPMEAEARAILTAIVNFVPIAEMPEPEPAALEKE
jgi:plasmid stability protein